jgi:hypothetical protein
MDRIRDWLFPVALILGSLGASAHVLVSDPRTLARR